MPLVLIAALLAALTIAACGEDEDARQLIEEAFSQPIESADVTATADLRLEGAEELTEPVLVEVSGPFQTGGPDKLPSFDLDVALRAQDAEVPPFGLISTGDNVFVEVAGTPYEVGERAIAAQNRALAGENEDATGLGALGVDPLSWIEEADVEGEEEVAGAPTTHVSARVNVGRVLADLNEAAQNAPELGAGPAPTLSEEELSQLEEAIEAPSFEVFVGEDDNTLRRLTTSLSFRLPEEDQADLGGVSGGTLAFTIEFANVGGDQQIEAPSDARPLTDLLQQLGGLGGVLGEQGAGPPAGPEGAGGSGGLSPEAQAFQEYSRCLQQADPSDQQALAECDELLVP